MIKSYSHPCGDPKIDTYPIKRAYSQNETSEKVKKQKREVLDNLFVKEFQKPTSILWKCFLTIQDVLSLRQVHSLFRRFIPIRSCLRADPERVLKSFCQTPLRAEINSICAVKRVDEMPRQIKIRQQLYSLVNNTAQVESFTFKRTVKENIFRYICSLTKQQLLVFSLDKVDFSFFPYKKEFLDLLEIKKALFISDPQLRREKLKELAKECPIPFFMASRSFYALGEIERHIELVDAMPYCESLNSWDLLFLGRIDKLLESSLEKDKEFYFYGLLIENPQSALAFLNQGIFTPSKTAIFRKLYDYAVSKDLQILFNEIENFPFLGGCCALLALLQTDVQTLRFLLAERIFILDLLGIITTLCRLHRVDLAYEVISRAEEDEREMLDEVYALEIYNACLKRGDVDGAYEQIQYRYGIDQKLSLLETLLGEGQIALAKRFMEILGPELEKDSDLYRIFHLCLKSGLCLFAEKFTRFQNQLFFSFVCLDYMELGRWDTAYSFFREKERRIPAEKRKELLDLIDSKNLSSVKSYKKGLNSVRFYR